MVGRGARIGSTTNEMAFPLASAVRLSPRHRRIPLHGFDVAALDRVVGDQGNVGAASEPRQSGHQGPSHIGNLADALWRRARFRIVRACVARDSRSRAGFGTRIAIARGALAMACSAGSVAGLDLAMLDCQLGGFFQPLSVTHSNRISIRISRSRSTYRRVPLARACGHEANQVGACLALDRALAVHDPNGWSFPVEFSLASIFPFGTGNLRWGSTANGVSSF